MVLEWSCWGSREWVAEGERERERGMVRMKILRANESDAVKELRMVTIGYLVTYKTEV